MRSRLAEESRGDGRVKVSVIVPTVKGRAGHLASCMAAYAETLHGTEFEMIVIPDRPTVAAAWNAGVQYATGGFLHFTADDLEPMAGWLGAAIEAVECGGVPAPVVYGPSGVFESCGGTTSLMADWEPARMSAIPFCSREQFEHIGLFDARLHYFSDDLFSDRARRAGFPVLVREDYAFRHYWAEEGRGAGMTESERMEHDRAIYCTIQS